ncbi:hypothetical protein [Streptomyces sp. Inha503]|uniref:hypothetical protein n=1 Tax=Streptomyces sp. Inha503 TaxID=3383314 RepID=UPI0039A0A536
MPAVALALKCVVCYARISFDGRAKDAHGIADQHRGLAATAKPRSTGGGLA